MIKYILAFIFLLNLHIFDFNDKFLFNTFYLKSTIIDFEIKNKKKELIVLDKIKKNLSGITYSSYSNTLFAITNSPRVIYELSKETKILREIPLNNFKDTEDITHIKDDLFAIIDERDETLYVVNINEDTKIINKKDSIKKYKFNIKRYKNFGIEGVTYDIKKDKFYLVNEKFPKKVITLEGLITNKEPKVDYNQKILKQNYYLSDFSAIYYDKEKNDLFILSEESSLIGQVNSESKFISFYNLKDNDLSSKMKSAEGFTMDNERNIYIVSEPNLLLSLKK